jgi:hypothetical protein
MNRKSKAPDYAKIKSKQPIAHGLRNQRLAAPPRGSRIQAAKAPQDSSRLVGDGANRRTLQAGDGEERDGLLLVRRFEVRAEAAQPQK